MKTLEEHNREAMELMKLSDAPRGNGIACPKCGAELVDEPGVSLPTNPPKTPIHCLKCDYGGSRF